MTDDLTALRAENERLREALNKLNRRATDCAYMLEHAVQMLGPLGRQVWKAWKDKGVERVHVSWGPAFYEMTGEQVAQAHLDMIEAQKTATPIDDIDGYIAARKALETK